MKEVYEKFVKNIFFYKLKREEFTKTGWNDRIQMHVVLFFR